jgi:hypothetical protein
VAVDPRREVDRLVEAYREFHRGRLHPRRDRARFLRCLDDGAGAWYFAVGAAGRGYLRLGAEGRESLDVDEMILGDPAEEGPALRAVARLALSLSRKTVRGWFEPSAFVDAWFATERRTTAVPMLRGAPPAVPSRFWPSDHF